MNVVLIGAAQVHVHAIARALGRALDAMVVDGDALLGIEADGDDEQRVEALERTLAHPRTRPHAVATYTAPPLALRRLLGQPGFRLVAIHDHTDAPGASLLDDHSIVEPPSLDIEAVATRVFGRLVIP